jgi:glycosyltransferase involved in cell wall biosynthesis
VLLLARPEVLSQMVDSSVPGRPLGLGGDLMLPDAVRLARALRGFEPHALLISHFSKVLLAGLAGRLARVPRVVARVALSSYRADSWKYRFSLRRLVDITVANADEIKDRFAMEVPDLDPRRLRTIHNGVFLPPLQHEPGWLRSALNIPSRARVVGTVGRLATRKRVDWLIRAVAVLPPDLHCVVAGDGPSRSELESLARSIGIAERIHFLGHRTDVRDILEGLDVFVITSDHEGMSNSMLEAMAAGVAVITTDVSGAREALDPLPEGIVPGLVVGHELDQIIRVLDSLLEEPSRIAKMGRAGRRRARERFDYDRMVDRWEDVLLGESRSDSPAMRTIHP